MLFNLLLGSFIWGAVPLVFGLLFCAFGWLGPNRRKRARRRDAA